MRVNVYSQEVTGEVEIVRKVAQHGPVYHGIRLLLHSSDRLHNVPGDDDRSAVTIWLPQKGGEGLNAIHKALQSAFLIVEDIRRNG